MRLRIGQAVNPRHNFLELIGVSIGERLEQGVLGDDLPVAVVDGHQDVAGREDLRIRHRVRQTGKVVTLRNPVFEQGEVTVVRVTVDGIFWQRLGHDSYYRSRLKFLSGRSL